MYLKVVEQKNILWNFQIKVGAEQTFEKAARYWHNGKGSIESIQNLSYFSIL